MAATWAPARRRVPGADRPARLAGLLGPLLLVWTAVWTAVWAAVWAALPQVGQPPMVGWLLPAAGAVAAVAVVAGWQLRRGAAIPVLPVAAPVPGRRPTSRPVPARLCDPAAPGRPRPRAPGRRGCPRAA